MAAGPTEAPGACCQPLWVLEPIFQSGWLNGPAAKRFEPKPMFMLPTEKPELAEPEGRRKGSKAAELYDQFVRSAEAGCDAVGAEGCECLAKASAAAELTVFMGKDGTAEIGTPPIVAPGVGTTEIADGDGCAARFGWNAPTS